MILRNFLLASDNSVFIANVPSIYKQLQKFMRQETLSEVLCLIPELYYQICVISMEYPLPGITVPLIVNEMFSLFKREEYKLRSFSCRYGAMLFSELVCLRWCFVWSLLLFSLLLMIDNDDNNNDDE